MRKKLISMISHLLESPGKKKKGRGKLLSELESILDGMVGVPLESLDLNQVGVYLPLPKYLEILLSMGWSMEGWARRNAETLKREKWNVGRFLHPIQ